MRNDFGVDQADGLRRLLVSNQTRVITLVAGKSGVGRTSTTINLAAALARSGKDVLVLDENDVPGSVLDRLGFHAKHDLLDVVKGRCSICEAMQSTGGYSVLSTARTMSAMATSRTYEGRASDSARLDQAGQLRLEGALTEAGSGVDVMLVDAAMPVPSRIEGQAGSAAALSAAKASGDKPFAGVSNSCYTVSSSLARGTALLVVVDATASGITESYALIKRLALENARLQFEIVVNKVADEQAARTVFENMAILARRNLAARLEYVGCIPLDDRLKRAMQLGKSVVEAFPTSISAQSYMGLAQKLLLMPVRQDEAEGGVSTVIRNLMKHASQTQQRLSREIAQVVN